MAESTTDEWFDTIAFRPVARGLAHVLVKTPITANQVTFVSGVCGVFAGVTFVFDGWWPLIGGVSLLLMMVLDCADGELARMRGGGGWRGRMIDGLADVFTATALHIGMLLSLTMSGIVLGGWEVPAVAWFVVVFAAACSFTWNSGVVDAYKQRLKPDSVDSDVESFASEVDGLWDRFLYWMLVEYTARTTTVPSLGPERDQVLFRYVRWVGPTGHHLWLAIAGMCAVYSPMAYFYYMLITIIPGNIYLVGVRLVERHMRNRRMAGAGR